MGHKEKKLQNIPQFFRNYKKFFYSEYLRDGAAPRQVPSKEVQDPGEVIRPLRLPPDDDPPPRARPRGRDQRDVRVR